MFNKAKKADLLTTELERKILIGEYAIDENLPPENELCSQYGVSRTTVREAIGTLSSRGLVERKHGIGVMVTNETVAAGSRALDLAVRSNSIPIEDILSIRQILEIESVAWAAATKPSMALPDAANCIAWAMFPPNTSFVSICGQTSSPARYSRAAAP